jgi:hypothetical protein
MIARSHHAYDVMGGFALCTKTSETYVQVTLRQFAALRINDEAMVMINRFGQSKQELEQPMHTCRRKQITPPSNMGDALKRIIHNDSQMIAGGRILPRQNNVTPPFWTRQTAGFMTIGVNLTESQPTAFQFGLRGQHCSFHVQPYGKGLAGRFARLHLSFGLVAKQPGIDRGAIWIENRLPLSRRRFGNLFSRGETGIDQSHCIELRQSARIIGEVLGLTPGGALPVKPQPSQIFVNLCFELTSASGLIDILNAQQKTPAPRFRRRAGKKRGVGVAEMEFAIRSWREAKDRAMILKHHSILSNTRSDSKIFHIAASTQGTPYASISTSPRRSTA